MTGQYALTIEQGIVFTKSFKWMTLTDPSNPNSPRIPVDITGMTAKAPIRTRDGLLLGEFLCTVNGAAGEVVLGLSDQQTAEFEFDTAIADIDLHRADGARVKRLLRMTVTLCRDVEDPGVGDV